MKKAIVFICLMLILPSFLYAEVKPLGIEGLPVTGGHYWFVSSTGVGSGAGSNSNSNASDNHSYRFPFATIDKAINSATAQSTTYPGDIIVVFPSHNEYISTTTELVPDVKGLYFKGLGEGEGRPHIYIDSNVASILISGANTVFDNFIFDSDNGDFDIAEFFDAGADDIKFKNCKFKDTKDNVLKFIQIDGANTADRFVLENCEFTGGTASGDYAVFIDDAQDGVIIRNNVFYGYYDYSAIGSDAINTNMTIADNIAHNNVSGAYAIKLTAASTGSLADNRLFSDAFITMLDPGSLKCSGNLGTTSIDAPGIVLPLGGDMGQKCVIKSDGAVLSGNDDIFVIAGGPVIAKIVGRVTTIIGGAANGRLKETTTSPSATIDLNAGAVAIDSDAVGTIYNNIGATSVFTPSTGLGFVLLDPVTVEETEFILTPGTVHFNSSAARTGVIEWYMTYTPLSPYSYVYPAT